MFAFRRAHVNLANVYGTENSWLEMCEATPYRTNYCSGALCANVHDIQVLTGIYAGSVLLNFRCESVR
jgi:hypothetical protein